MYLQANGMIENRVKMLSRGILFFYINIAIFYVNGNPDECIETFDSNACTFDMLCQSRFALRQSINDYHYSNRPDLRDINGLDNINCKLINDAYYPIHLKIKQANVLSSNTDNALPQTTESDMLLLITWIDLSSKSYENVPIIRSLDNLAVLNLSENIITVAMLSNKYELPSLTEINYSHNTVTDIQYNDFNEHVYRKLKKIDLSYNYITEIVKAVFHPFEGLESLDLSHNYIDTLSHITFEGTMNLLCLNVSYNRISNINLSLFRNNELKFLDISNNNIKYIKTTDFQQLINLKTLDLNSNSISVIEKGSFDSLSLLDNLYINNNKLENLEKDILSNANQLINIDMSENQFKSIPRGLFKNKNVHFFSIKDNSLEGSIVKGTFLGLTSVLELDLSNQNLNSIDDYGFHGMNNIQVLLLKENNISLLSSKCFRTIPTLKRLDLSSNKIVNIEFEKDDLLNLIFLSLRNNDLTYIKQNNFYGLNYLQFLDLSNNKITQVESHSFKSLRELINFEISNNPLKGTLEESTFDGLNSLPGLDISCTLLSIVQNGSFFGMIQLKTLNISRSKINVLELNAFAHTGAIESIDLSFNALKEFNINSTELLRLNTLYLNNNQIKTLYYGTFQSITRLENLYVSNNIIQNIDSNIFTNLNQLRLLDISYNKNFKLSNAVLEKMKNVAILNLSGIKTNISFNYVKDVSVSHLILSNSSLSNLNVVHLNELQNLETLRLEYNKIAKLEVGIFYNISTLKDLDLSNNNISYIQPGVFRDNIMLQKLNISHNYLTSISYGIFRGLIYLNTLDISFNNIKDLQNERFYELISLGVLLADNNKIETINVDEFQGTRLTELSIGDNPIACDILVNIKRHGSPFVITAIKLDYNDDNFEGVTCNKKTNTRDSIVNGSVTASDNNSKVLISIKDILLDHFNNYQSSTSSSNMNDKYLFNITDEIEKTNLDVSSKITNIYNATMQVNSKNNETNVLLNKILNVLISKSTTTLPPVRITKNNATYENLVLYINKVKQELELSMQSEKVSILNEVETKFSEVNSRVNGYLLTSEMPQHEKFTMTKDSKSYFTEICVALILIILVSFVLFKMYKSRKFVRQRFSISTRELPDAMDSTL